MTESAWKRSGAEPEQVYLCLSYFLLAVLQHRVSQIPANQSDMQKPL